MTQTLGDPILARRALEFARSDVPYNTKSTTFRWLGAGISRKAYLGPDGIVYKVGGRSDNDIEYRAMRALAPLCENHPEFGVPMVSQCDIVNPYPNDPTERQYLQCVSVIAAEYIKGEETWHLDSYGNEDDESHISFRAEEFFGTSDLHSGNVQSYRGKYYVLDLGFSKFGVVK